MSKKAPIPLIGNLKMFSKSFVLSETMSVQSYMNGSITANFGEVKTNVTDCKEYFSMMSDQANIY